MAKIQDWINQIPKEVEAIVGRLIQHGFEAYVVGGSVRDLLLGKTPKDWDVTTNAKPEEITKLFPDSFYENKFLTVTVKTGSEDETLREVEVTTYRTEGKYSDQRHPDSVDYAKSIEEDLSRRDFTINAIALAVKDQGSTIKDQVVDPYGGEKDLAKRLVRAVGDPKIRFEEDALRMMRAVRFATELEFEIEPETKAAIKEHAAWIQATAKDRIRDELTKMFAAKKSAGGIELLRELGLLKFILPELEEGIGVTQNKHHIYTVWDHNLNSLRWADQENYAVPVKIASLVHDIAKPRTKEGDGPNSTFYQHDVVGGTMSWKALEELHFPKEIVQKVARLVRWHMFKYDPDEGITDSAIRRLIRRVGVENMEDLVRLRIADRMGSGVHKAVPYRLRHFQFRVEKILREEEAPTPKMLKLNGSELMELLAIEPGPKVGYILAALLEEVIDDPEKNNKEYLSSRAKELHDLSIEELKKLAESAESKVELVEGEREAELKNKYYVK